MALATRVRHTIGTGLSHVENAVLSSAWFPLTRYLLRGHFCWYDIQRFASTRNFDVIFDVGANRGQTAEGLVQYFRNANIYCFEPSSTPFEALQAGYERHKNVHCIQRALGAVPETRTLLTSSNSELNTFTANGPRFGQAISRETVRVDTIDLFCEEHNIDAINILKMDVQGWECEVLRGADRMISGNMIHFVLAEVGFSQEDTDICQFSSVHEEMERKGYQFCGLYESFRWGTNKQYVGFANALYVNPRFSNGTHPERLLALPQ